MTREIPVAKLYVQYIKTTRSHQYHRNILHFSGDPLKNSSANICHGAWHAREIKSNVI